MSKQLLGLSVISLLFTVGFANAQCPAVNFDTGCGTVITITDQGATVTSTGQGPYDGNDDTLVGVINNSTKPVFTLNLASNLGIFGFDGDGITAYGIAGNAKDASGYGGPNAYFTNINAQGTAGTVNFIAPIAANGGTAFFALENSLQSAVACSTIINNSVPRPTITQGNTGISATFTPNQGYSLAQAAQLCGFADFDWVQIVTTLPDPSPFTANNIGGAFSATPGPVHLTSKSTPFNDPPQGGGYAYQPSPDYSFPFYCNVAGDPACPKTATTLSIGDQPTDPCLVDSAGNPSNAYTGNAATRALCGNKTAPKGSFVAFTTHLAGVTYPGGAGTAPVPYDLGIGYTWTSNYNGTAGGVVQTKSIPQTPDPNSGTGGVTVSSYNPTTNYTYKGVGVTGVNSASSGAVLLFGSQVSVSASGLAYSRVTQTFNGTVTLTNVGSTVISGPVNLVLSSLVSTVTLKGASGSFGGFPYLAIPNFTTLGPGQSVSVAIQLSNPSNVGLTFTPLFYSGVLN